jgi:hypothetical protein
MAVPTVSLGDGLVIPTGACRPVTDLADKTLPEYTLGLNSHTAHAATTHQVGMGHARESVASNSLWMK